MLVHNPEKIILGCTHYPTLKIVLSMFAPYYMFIDPADFFVDYIDKDLESCGLKSDSTEKGYEKMYVSANPEQFKTASEMFYKLKELPELV